MPTQNNSTLYLYLGRRDLSGVRILAKFQGRSQLATRVNDLNTFQLPVGWAQQLTQIIYDSRMLWEPWIESAASFGDLRANLKLRGYSNIPINAQPELSVANLQTPQVNLSALPKRATMLKKGGS